MVSQLERSAGESRVNKIGVKLGYKSVFIDQADKRQTKSCNLKQIPTVIKAVGMHESWNSSKHTRKIAGEIPGKVLS